MTQALMRNWTKLSYWEFDSSGIKYKLCKIMQNVGRETSARGMFSPPYISQVIEIIITITTTYMCIG